MESYPLDHCPKCAVPRRSAAAIYCSRCGAYLRVPYPGTLRLSLPVGRTALILGAVSTLCGLGLYLWASANSPHMGFGEMLTTAAMDENAYLVPEPLYSMTVLFSASLCLGGIVLIVRELIREAKR